MRDWSSDVCSSDLGHAAEGYALATGRVGVCVATSGPGATNLITAIADAHMDSVPMVAITGQVGAASIGTDAFQEADIIGATMPFVKHSFLVTSPEEVPARVAEAFHLAATGRPGPVLIDVAKDAQVGPERGHGQARPARESATRLTDEIGRAHV